MRLFLLPLSVRRTFIYCDKTHAVSPHKLITAGSASKPASENNTSTAINEVADGQATVQTYVDKLTTKAASTWSDWEKAEGGWKMQLTKYGNAALRRIPYEEWGLKSFPPLTDARRESGLAKLKQNPVVVLFPSLFLKQGDVDATLLTLAKERQALHKQRMWYCLVGAPLTLPFALIPILPNIPGFYLSFRAWSHYRALYGARHLQFLVENKLYQAKPSSRLDRLYTEINTPSDSKSTGSGVAAKIHERIANGEEDVVLLTKDGGKKLAETLGVNELGIELERAVEQVEKIVLEKEQEAKDAAQTKQQ